MAKQHRSKEASKHVLKAEAKFVVDVKQSIRESEEAKKLLAKLDREPQPARVEVLFFDTRKLKLQDVPNLAHAAVILRARLNTEGTGNATVKLREKHPAKARLGYMASNVPEERDYAEPGVWKVSRSLDQKKVTRKVFEGVREGRFGALALFNKKQRQLIAELLPWPEEDKLRCYGPVHSEVWKERLHLRHYPEPVTVERWTLLRGKARKQILELSANIRAADKVELAARVRAFYAAVGDAFSAARQVSKTSDTLKFFAPGQPTGIA